MFAASRVWIVLAGLVILTRLPALLHPRAIDDEQVYAVIGRELAQGGLPYLDAVERKPPLLFAVYSLVLGATGLRNWPALHVVGVLWTLATMAGLHLALRRRFDWQTGAVAAALYGLYQMWGDYRMLALNGELLMNLPIVLAVALAFRTGAGKWRPELVLAGGLIALATLLKQPAGIAGAALAWYVLCPAYARSRGLDTAHRLGHGFFLAVGFAGTLGVVGILLTREGILRETLYWSIQNHADAVGPSTWHYWDKALSNTLFFLVEAAPLCLAAAATLWSNPYRALWNENRAEHQALSVLLVASILGVSINGQFLFHYYLQLLPPLCLLAAPVLRQLIAGVVEAPHVRYRRVAIAWLVLSLVAFTTVDAVGLALNRKDSEAGLWVRANSTPDDRLYVWGQGDRKTGMYLDADRRPATRFIAPFPLTGHVFGGYPREWGREYKERHVMPGAWDTLRLDFAKHPPRYIIDAEGTQSKDAISKYPALSEILRDFRKVAETADGTVYENGGMAELRNGGMVGQ